MTALYATATFFTYGFSLLLLHTPLSRTIISAIIVAFSGVLLIAFSGARAENPTNDDSEGGGPPHRILGDLIMLFGAAVLGLYEVIYKLSLPEGQGGVVTHDKMDQNTAMPIVEYNAVHQLYDGSNDHPSPSPRPTSTTHRRSSSLPVLLNPGNATQEEHQHLPIGLHANFLTSCIGITTLVVFWIPLPFLDMVGWEDLKWPGKAMGSIGWICLAGATYVSTVLGGLTPPFEEKGLSSPDG